MATNNLLCFEQLIGVPMRHMALAVVAAVTMVAASTPDSLHYMNELDSGEISPGFQRPNGRPEVEKIVEALQLAAQDLTSTRTHPPRSLLLGEIRKPSALVDDASMEAASAQAFVSGGGGGGGFVKLETKDTIWDRERLGSGTEPHALSLPDTIIETTQYCAGLDLPMRLPMDRADGCVTRIDVTRTKGGSLAPRCAVATGSSLEEAWTRRLGIDLDLDVEGDVAVCRVDEDLYTLMTSRSLEEDGRMDALLVFDPRVPVGILYEWLYNKTDLIRNDEAVFVEQQRDWGKKKAERGVQTDQLIEELDAFEVDEEIIERLGFCQSALSCKGLDVHIKRWTDGGIPNRPHSFEELQNSVEIIENIADERTTTTLKLLQFNEDDVQKAYDAEINNLNTTRISTLLHRDEVTTQREQHRTNFIDLSQRIGKFLQHAKTRQEQLGTEQKAELEKREGQREKDATELNAIFDGPADSSALLLSNCLSAPEAGVPDGLDQVDEQIQCLMELRKALTIRMTQLEEKNKQGEYDWQVSNWVAKQNTLHYTQAVAAVSPLEDFYEDASKASVEVGTLALSRLVELAQDRSRSIKHREQQHREDDTQALVRGMRAYTAVAMRLKRKQHTIHKNRQEISTKLVEINYAKQSGAKRKVIQLFEEVEKTTASQLLEEIEETTLRHKLDKLSSALKPVVSRIGRTLFGEEDDSETDAALKAEYRQFCGGGQGSTIGTLGGWMGGKIEPCEEPPAHQSIIDQLDGNATRVSYIEEEASSNELNKGRDGVYALMKAATEKALGWDKVRLEAIGNGATDDL